jgi:hypothetical protein
LRFALQRKLLSLLQRTQVDRFAAFAFAFGFGLCCKMLQQSNYNCVTSTNSSSPNSLAVSHSA